MQLFKWKKAHEVFLPQIDAEHRNLFRLGEEIHGAIQAGADPDHIRGLLRSLEATTEEHFLHEERRMRAVQYSAYAWHKQQHDTARKRLKELSARIEAGDGKAPGELLEFLAHWLHDHTRLTDRMMGAHLRNQERLARAQAS